MMNRKTVTQLIQVFEQFKINYRNGVPLHNSYQDAVRKIADKYAITYQTVGDGCRRRLNLADISQLHVLLEEWMQGHPESLITQLRQNSIPAAHPDIDAFFSATGPSSVTAFPEISSSLPGKSADTFSFPLLEADARLLRALAEIEGSTPSRLITQIVQKAVNKKMKKLAGKL